MKNNKFQIVAIVALVLSVAGLTVGFAAFSQTLRISSSAEYSVDVENASEFKVAFTTDREVEYNKVVEGSYTGGSEEENHGVIVKTPISGSVSPKCAGNTHDSAEESTCSSSSSGVSASNANISDTTVTGIHANFSGSNKIVVYELPIANYGFLDAYLKSIVFNGTKTCTVPDDAEISQERLNEICNKINIKYSIFGNDYTSSANGISSSNRLYSGDGMITTLELTAGEDIPLTTYEVTVNFPDIELNFSSTNS